MKKLLYFLFAAVALMLSSCGGEQEGVHLKNFKIELTEPAAEENEIIVFSFAKKI